MLIKVIEVDFREIFSKFCLQVEHALKSRFGVGLNYTAIGKKGNDASKLEKLLMY